MVSIRIVEMKKKNPLDLRQLLFIKLKRQEILLLPQSDRFSSFTIWLGKTTIQREIKWSKSQSKKRKKEKEEYKIEVVLAGRFWYALKRRLPSSNFVGSSYVHPSLLIIYPCLLNQSPNFLILCSIYNYSDCFNHITKNWNLKQSNWGM